MEQANTPSVQPDISPAGENQMPEGEAGQELSEQSPPQQPQKYKLKVNNKVIEKSIDEIIKDAELGLGAHEKFRKADEIAKKYSKYEQMEQAIESGNFNPLIEKMGHQKFREFAENYLIDYLEYQQLSPEKKEALEYRRLYEQQKAELDAKQKEAKDQEMSQVRAQAMDEIDREITEVLKASGKQPKPYFVARIAENMLASLQTRSVDPKMAAKSAFERALSSVQDDVSEYLSGMSVDEARQVLPKALLDALRKSEVEAVRSQDPMRSRSNPKTETKSRQDGKKVRMTTDEFFKQRIEKIIGA